MIDLEIISNELKSKHNITINEHIRSIKTTVIGNKCFIDGMSHNYSCRDNNEVILRSPTIINDIPTVVNYLTGIKEEDSVIFINCFFFGTDDTTGRRAYYNVKYYYKSSNQNEITITDVDIVRDSLDDLIHVEKNNGLPVYAAFQQDNKLIIYSYLSDDKRFDIPGNAIVKTYFNVDSYGIEETKYNFFSHDDNRIYLNQIVGTLNLEYDVSLESYQIFTNRDCQSRIVSIEPVNHEDDDLMTFDYLDKCTIIVTYENGLKQLLIINNILGPGRRIFRTKLYDDIRYIQNCRGIYDTNGIPVDIEPGLQFELANGNKTEYYFISADRDNKNYGKRRVYTRSNNLVPANKDNDEEY